MSTQSTLFQAVPVFFVEDVARSMEWFEQKLGWQPGFVFPEGGEAPSYASVCLGKAAVHLARHDPDRHGPGRSHCYVFVSGVDAYHASVVARGLDVEGPKTWHYGMREFVAVDPDGNHLCFGQGVETAE